MANLSQNSNENYDRGHHRQRISHSFVKIRRFHYKFIRQSNNTFSLANDIVEISNVFLCVSSFQLLWYIHLIVNGASLFHKTIEHIREKNDKDAWNVQCWFSTYIILFQTFIQFVHKLYVYLNSQWISNALSFSCFLCACEYAHAHTRREEKMETIHAVE